MNETITEEGFNLCIPAGVASFMNLSESTQDWNERCDAVKKANGGEYPDFWFATMIQSGMADMILRKLGSSADIKMMAIDMKGDKSLC